MDFTVNAALWAVGKALAPVTDGLLESWADSTELGINMDALKMELLYAQGMLDNAPNGNNIRSTALKELLYKLRELAYGADDVLDELDYFRIKDMLQGSYHAADTAGLILNARHTARATMDRLKPTSHTRIRSAARTTGKHLSSCFSVPSTHDNDAKTAMPTPKIEFDRVGISQKMREIVEQLKPICAKVFSILSLELLGSRHISTQDIALNRTKTTPSIVENTLYGRDTVKKEIVAVITDDKYRASELTVLPILGPGGIGKTTLVQHIFQQVKNSFQVSIWVCVSRDFNANRLAQEIVKKIHSVTDEKKNASDEELIEQRLQSKRLLLVLDDVWTYHEDEWKKLTAPLRKEKGHMVIVTTRIPEVASKVRETTSSVDLERLGPNDIMSFFEVCVFGEQEKEPWKKHKTLEKTGKVIVNHLKGFPLAAKTVGRLLRRKLTVDHWNQVAESREWERQTGDNDIMPSLKLSYDYLPFHLQQCFSFCALFPEDYEFSSKELVHLWIGLDILHLDDHNTRTENVGISYLDDLVSNGFFKLIKKEDGSYYAIHDLLHELAANVSSYDCLSIRSSNVRSIKISPSVRHLSIIVDNTDVKDSMTFKDYKTDLCAIDKKLKIQNVRTLMLFGEHHGSFVTPFSDLLKEARNLRTIFLSGASYSVDDMFLNFSKLLHLRYLRIKSRQNKEITLPSALSRFHHLEVIDIEKWGGSLCPTGDFSNLVKLRHFLVPKNHLELHSEILEVGNLKFLEELRRFEVGKESKGFEISQLGGLTELGGSLAIYNLEKLKREEARELKLIHKRHLHKLLLEWNNTDAQQEKDVLESLVPHDNLRDLCIRGHGGANYPSWLGANLSVRNLESLCLDNVSWEIPPPLGSERNNDRGVVEWCQSFQNLTRLELVNIPNLIKWVGNGTSPLFSVLEVLVIENCPVLTVLPFSQPENMTCRFPQLRELRIVGCPQLSSLPPIPWTPTPCSIHIEQVGTGSSFKSLDYYRKAHISLNVEGNDYKDDTIWSKICFDNLAYLKQLEMSRCAPLTLIQLQNLTSLETLELSLMGNILLLSEGESHNTGCLVPVENIYIDECGANGKELTQLLSHFPKLTGLTIRSCENITGIVLEHEKAAPPSPANEIEDAHTRHQEQQPRDKDKELPGEGVLYLPPKLERFWVVDCPKLRLISNNEEKGGLRNLYIRNCPAFFSLTPASFPPSLQFLTLNNIKGMNTLVPLSNLKSLTTLNLYQCEDLTGEGLLPLLTHCPLTTLRIRGTPRFFTGVETSEPPHDEVCLSKLEHLLTDDLAGVLNLHMCRLLSSSLTTLIFYEDKKMECFTTEQEKALHLLTSLQEFEFNSCTKLQNLPSGLDNLTNLKKLKIRKCEALQSLPKDGLPSHLQELDARGCGNGKELMRQCRKLKGTIPIILDYDQ